MISIHNFFLADMNISLKNQWKFLWKNGKMECRKNDRAVKRKKNYMRREEEKKKGWWITITTTQISTM